MRLHVPIKLRWSDLDAYGHVNNAEMLRLLEEARIQAFWVADDGSDGASLDEHAVGGSTAILDGRPGADTLTLIARQEIEYLLPVPYLREPLDIELWLGRLGGASLLICYEMYTPVGVEPRLLYTRATSTLVMVDAATERPRRINTRERVAWSPYLDEPLEFSRR